MIPCVILNYIIMISGIVIIVLLLAWLIFQIFNKLINKFALLPLEIYTVFKLLYIKGLKKYGWNDITKHMKYKGIDFWILTDEEYQKLKKID